MNFQNSSYVIIGASGGIGSALARMLHQNNGQPVLFGRSTDRLAALAAELNAQSVAVDASKIDELEQAVASVQNLAGIVNCAGSILLKPGASYY